jgi:predicted nucleic acid-binding protein
MRQAPRRSPPVAFLDANFVIAAHFDTVDLHLEARDLLASLRTGPNGEKTTLCMSTRVIDEVLWTARRLFFERDHGPDTWVQLSPRRRSEAWVRYSEEIAHLGRILLSPHAPWDVLSVTSDDLGVAIGAMESHSLQPADASHYAVAMRACDGCIVTNDRHFRGLADLTVIRYDEGD